MTENWLLGAYWGPRPESSDQCADRLAECWRALADRHPALATWYLRADSERAAHRPIETRREQLVELIESGRNRRDFTGDVIESLGFHVGAWNGSQVSFGARLGGSTGTNHAVMEFAVPGGDVDGLLEPQGAVAAVATFVNAFSPAWVTLRTIGHGRAQPRVKGLPMIGWLTWLHEPEPRIPAGPAASPLEGGWLYRAAATPEQATDEAIGGLHPRLFGVR